MLDRLLTTLFVAILASWGRTPQVDVPSSRQESAEEPRVTTIATSEPLPSQGRLGGVAVSAAGELYVSNFGATVWRISASGEVEALATNLRGSSGNALDRDGYLLQASFLDGRIVRIGPDGEVTDLISSGLQGPIGLTVGDDGSVYVCNCRSNSIARVTAAGSVSEFGRSPDLDCPNGITVGPDGALYVVSFNNGHVVRIDPTGRAARFATIAAGRNAHIAYASGAFWITKIETNVLYRLGLDGSAARYAGTGEIGFADGPVDQASLARPNGIAVAPDGGAVIVNTLEGEWRGERPTRIVLRRIDLPTQMNELQRIQVPARDMVFDALAAGPADGELVLLLHGFPQTGLAFSSQLEALGAAGYRAVAPDQRGYAPGARPDSVAAYSMGALVGDVIGIADALGRERFHLVGHDWGGAVAWVTATRHPDRVRTLMVLSTPHFAAFGAQLADSDSEQAQRSSYFADFTAPGAEERLLAEDRALLREILSGVPAVHRDAYLEHLGRPEALRAALNWYRASAPRPGTSRGAPGRPAPPPATPIRVPTVYVWGTKDAAFGRAAAESTADFVSGPYEFHALEGVGHWVPELAAHTVNRLLLRHLRHHD